MSIERVEPKDSVRWLVRIDVGRDLFLRVLAGGSKSRPTCAL